VYFLERAVAESLGVAARLAVEAINMNDIFLKLWILILHIRNEYYIWKDNIWNGDLDQHLCCDGRECGCEGVSLRDSYFKRRTSQSGNS